VEGSDLNGVVAPSESECPESSMESQEKSESPPPEAMECVMSGASSSKEGKGPTNPKSKPSRMCLETMNCDLFSVLQMNTELDLDLDVEEVDNAYYNSAIGIVEVRLGPSRVGWIWANGVLMIFNGGCEEQVAETLSDMSAKIMGNVNFKVDVSDKILHLRLCSSGNFPWSVNLQEFRKAHAISLENLRETNFAFYVDKEIPGVAAKLFDTGLVEVFAMTSTEADEMVKTMYLLSYRYRNK